MQVTSLVANWLIYNCPGTFMFIWVHLSPLCITLSHAVLLPTCPDVSSWIVTVQCADGVTTASACQQCPPPYSHEPPPPSLRPQSDAAWAHLPLQPGTWPQVSTAALSLPSAWPPTLPQEPQCSRIRDVEIMWLECFHPASRNQVLRIVYLRGRRPQTNILF